MTEKLRPFFKKTSLFLGIFILGGCCTSVLFLYLRSSGGATTLAGTARPIQLGLDGLVNPLLAYAVPQNTSELRILHASLEERIKAYQKKNLLSNASVYFRDLDTAYWTGVDETQKFSPASLLKVPTMISYLKIAEVRPEILSEKILYNGSFDDNAIEDIKPFKSIEPGISYTVEDLIKYMIAYSDNNATNLLFHHVPTDAFIEVYTNLGIAVPTSTNDFLGPRSYSLFFRVLYNATYLNKGMSQKALELLSYPDFPQGLSAGVPEHVIVAQKFGEHSFPNGTKELHDCGIIYHPQHPYFLCIMTKGDDFTNLSEVIRGLSNLVYAAADNNYK